MNIKDKKYNKKEILDIYIQPKYTDYTIDNGVLNRSRDVLKNKLSHIKMC